jgi:anhydro-N-acetylmuramic acid kinase
MKKYFVIGLMSGTSLDGLDISYCSYSFSNEKWSHDLICSETYPYSEGIKFKLSKATEISSIDLHLLHIELGKLFAHHINSFIEKNKILKKEIDAISSHGHTIFHQPQREITIQIACGTTVSILTGIKVINDFRSKDVLLGGNGAPLVPIGDKLLFNNKAESFLNIGGICNISYEQNLRLIAFDICPGNIPLNKLINKLGFEYDENGKNAASGSIDNEILSKLNNLEYYTQKPPKSLGIEWVNKFFFPIIDNHNTEIKNLLRTCVEHMAIQISKILNSNKIKTVMVSGGGAFNQFLIERIQFYFDGDIYIPDNETINFKESIIFGFLGALYLEKQENVLSTVTGAARNSCSGVLHLPN